MKILFISLIILAMLPLVAFADAVEINGIYYNLVPKAKAAEVTSNPKKYSGTIVILETVEYSGIQYSVTSIGESAFRDCSGLTSITIPNSVTSIGQSAFNGCSGLTSTTIPNSVTSIGRSVFFNCSSLTSVIIPNSVTSIETNAFYKCSSLTNITIPNSVTNIGDHAFYKCSSLTNITIPNSVTNIGAGAFRDCSGLTSITIPKSVTSIGGHAFFGCSSLTSVTICNSVTYIYESAFASCYELLDVFCYAADVPNTSANAFEDSYPETITLYVPESALENYKTLSPWSSFKYYVALPNYKLTYIVDGETYKTFKYEEDRTIPVESAPKKEGYTFSGWSEIPETMPAHDVEVTGSFTINTYKLTYIVDGVEYKVADVEYGATIVPEEAPEKPSYAFTSWDNLPETMPAHDVTVTATYEKTFLGKCATPTIAFKDGKFKFESEEEGVEFVWNINVVGNSGKGSEVGTPRKYVLSVCATKEFYEDSDPATMEMGMSSPIGDVNGDGVVNAADIATLVDIILHM